MDEDRRKVGRLLFPALRWDQGSGFSHLRDEIERSLEVGVGGFILFKGEASAVRELTAELRERSPHPLLIGSDLERGAGQQFEGATPLPPAAALGALDDEDVTRRAGELTAREARALGVSWVYAPVADVDLEPANPIVGTRAFGSDAEHVARHVAAWIRGCRSGGGLSCAKHFPGHGRTTADSHAELPRVDVTAEALEEDLLPFRAAIEADVDSVMTAHVVYPALDWEGFSATQSGPVLQGLLREKFGYEGLIVTDAMIMEGMKGTEGGEAGAGARALAAGVDALLYPDDVEAVAAHLREAVGRTVPAERVEDALRRVERAVASAPQPAGEWGAAEDRAWALETAVRSLRWVGSGPPDPLPAELTLATVDDDLGGPYPSGPRDAFARGLREAGIRVEEAEEGTDPGEDAPLLVALYADIRAWKGRPGLSRDAQVRMARLLQRRPAAVVLFAHPRLASELPEGEAPVLGAWGGEPLMQTAAARALTRAR